MKKLITLLALVFSAPVLAQPNVTSFPTEIIASSPNETAANSIATTNKVYIDQAGTKPNVNIQQTGVSNVVGTAADPIYLRGDNQNVTAIQTGNNNSLFMGIVGDMGGIAAGTSATIRQFGNNNTADIRCGTQSDASCNNLNLNAKFAGNNNALNFRGSAANITQTIDAEGNNNTISITDSSPNSSQTLLLTGDYNTINTTQTDAGGTYGHSLYANILGSNNILTTQQYGASETVINIKSIGSNGSFNIRTGH